MALPSHDVLTFGPGDVVLAAVYNPVEDPTSAGKVRPAVLVDELADRWLIAGLTTSRRRLDGVARVSVPHPYAVGLTGPGYLWGNRLHGIRKDDVLRRIGHAHAALAHRIADTHQMSEEARLALLRACGVMLPEHPEAC